MQKNSTEFGFDKLFKHEDDSYTQEASTLGWEAGFWPENIIVQNNRFWLMHLTSDFAKYESETGIKITIWND